MPKLSLSKAELEKIRELSKRAEGERALRELQRRKLISFSEFVFPKYIVGRHHKYVGDILDNAMEKKKGYNKLVIHEPPQHGKSTQASVLFPALYIGNFPNNEIMITAYNDTKAMDFSKKIRNIINSPEYQLLFPNIRLARDDRAAGRWALGYPYKGGMTAAGLGGGLTGRGADLLIIDDPIKNREEAESSLVREKHKETYRSTLKTRLHDNAIELDVMTRWHEDDLAGYLLKEENFRYIKLTALAEKDDILGRRLYGPLWEERFPQPMLLKTKKSVGLYNWESMYQGNPSPPSGLMFNRNMFKIIDKAPAGLAWCRFWDLAVTEGKAGDYTCSVRGAVNGSGDRFIDGRIYGKWEYPYVRELIKQTALQNPNDLVGIESQGVQKGMVQECWLDPELISIGILGITVSTSKRIRAMSTMTAGESGKLYLVKGDWNESLIEEHIKFDKGEHDDQVDAVSGVIRMLGMPVMDISLLNDVLVDGDYDFNSYEDRVETYTEDYFSVVGI